MITQKKILLFLVALSHFIAIALWIIMPEELILNLSFTIFSIIFFIFILIFFREDLKVIYLSSKFKSFSALFFGMFLVFFILSLVNFIAFKRFIQWDFSFGNRYTLSEYSKKVVLDLKDSLKIKIFSSKQDYLPISNLLQLYQLEFPKISLEFVDIELRPDQAKLNNITKSGTVLLEYMNKRQFILDVNEKNITNAIKRLLKGGHLKIYFSQNHGELDLESKENEGGAFLKDFIEKSDFEIISLKNSFEFDKSSLLVIWGPQLEFSDDEIKKLKDYFEQGGRAMIAFDPNFNQPQSEKLRKLLKDRGIIINNDIVIDKSSHISGSDGTIPVVAHFNSGHPVTKKFEGPLFFPLVSSINVDNFSKGSYSFMAQSEKAPYSWSETSPDEFFNNEIQYDKNKDSPGPITYVLSYQGHDHSNIIVFGNSSFVSNTYSQFTKHFLFFLNSMIWQVEGEEMISFQRPESEEQLVFVGRNQLGLIFYVSVLLLPFSMILVSFWMHKRRWAIL